MYARVSRWLCASARTSTCSVWAGIAMREAGVELIADCSEVSLVGIVEIAKKISSAETRLETPAG